MNCSAAPFPRKTGTRRRHPSNAVLAKLLVFEASLRDSVVQSVLENKPLSHLPDYAGALGLTESLSFAGRTITRVVDRDIVVAIRKLGKDCIAFALAGAPLERMETQYLYAIRESASSAELLQAIARSSKRLSSVDEMNQLLQLCDRDPAAAAVAIGACTATSRNWLIDGVMALARMHTDLRQGYGYPRLADDCQIPEFATLPGLTISQYCSRRKPIPDAHRKKLATGLSKRLAALLPGLHAPGLAAAVGQAAHLMETRLIPYREFDPVGALVRRIAAQCPGVSLESALRHGTALSEYANVQAATCKVLLAYRAESPPVLIAWQSANKNPRDKQKEFCGRIAMLRHTWDGQRKRFSRRPLGACLFIADGAWTPGQRRELARFGFDAVLSPTDLSQLGVYLGVRRNVSEEGTSEVSAAPLGTESG